jgi:thioredoxin 1
MKGINPLNLACMLLWIGALSSLRAQGQDGVHFFDGTLKEALAKAQAEKKLVFFDAYASWCGPCKEMALHVYTESAVAEYFNDKFVSIMVDMEKGEGPDLIKKYTSIDGYPSLLFMNNKGQVIKTLLGSRDAPALLAEAKLVH